MLRAILSSLREELLLEVDVPVLAAPAAVAGFLGAIVTMMEYRKRWFLVTMNECLVGGRGKSCLGLVRCQIGPEMGCCWFGLYKTNKM